MNNKYNMTTIHCAIVTTWDDMNIYEPTFPDIYEPTFPESFFFFFSRNLRKRSHGEFDATIPGEKVARRKEPFFKKQHAGK